MRTGKGGDTLDGDTGPPPIQSRTFVTPYIHPSYESNHDGTVPQSRPTRPGTTLLRNLELNLLGLGGVVEGVCTMVRHAP